MLVVLEVAGLSSRRHDDVPRMGGGRTPKVLSLLCGAAMPDGTASLHELDATFSITYR